MISRLSPHSAKSASGEAGGDDQLGAAAQELDPGLVADLDPTPGEQRHRARQVGGLAALGVVEGGAVGAQLVVEVVNAGVLGLTHITVLRLDGLAEAGISHVGLLEANRWEHVGRREHRLGPQGADTGAGEHVVVAAELLGPLGLAPSLDPQAAFVGIATEHITRGVQQRSAFLNRQ